MSIGTLALFVLLVAAACGGSAAAPTPTPGPRTPAVTPTAGTVPGSPEPAPDTLRIAYINLRSPITVDADDTVAAETYEERLDIVARELEELQPDIVAVSEATWAPELRNASWAMLASRLGMEAQFARANPWFPGMSEEESDAVVDLVGFEEGEAILSRYPIRQGNRIALNPRASENEGRIAFHVIVRIPGIGDTNVYISRLAGPPETRAEQALDLREVITETQEDRPTVVLADMGLGPESEAVQSFTGEAFMDLRIAAGSDVTLPTCCREDVLFNVPEGETDGGSPIAGTQTPTPQPAEPQPSGATPTPLPEQEAMTARTSYMFTDSWDATSFATFAAEPVVRPDGSRLYASDHNGIFAVISFEDWRRGVAQQ